MAIYRRSRKPAFRKKRYVKKTKVSSAVKKYVRNVARPMRPEIKRILDVYTETSIDSVVTPYFTYEPLISQGTGPYQRVGGRVRMTGLHVKAFFKNNATTTEFIRVLLVRTTSDTDTAAATMELFQDSNNGGTPGTIISSGTAATNILYAINKSKFKTLYDKVYKLGSTNSTDSRDVMLFNRFWKLNSQIKYDANQTGLGNQSTRYLLLQYQYDVLGLDDHHIHKNLSL